MWDSRDYGKLKVKILVEQFISLGFAINEDTALSFFKSMIEAANGGEFMTNEKILEAEVTVKQFNALFNSDVYTMRMLTSINNEIKEN
jgi:hypothetical protein